MLKCKASKTYVVKYYEINENSNVFNIYYRLFFNMCPRVKLHVQQIYNAILKKTKNKKQKKTNL